MPEPRLQARNVNSVIPVPRGSIAGLFVIDAVCGPEPKTVAESNSDQSGPSWCDERRGDEGWRASSAPSSRDKAELGAYSRFVADSLLEVAVTSETRLGNDRFWTVGVRMGVERPVNYLLKEKAGSTMLELKTFLDSSRLGAALLAGRINS